MFKSTKVKIITIILGFFMFFGFIQEKATAATEPGELLGSGTSYDPYKIQNDEDLNAFVKIVNNGKKDVCAVLLSDITVNSNLLNRFETTNIRDFELWTPINNFTGVFDGNGYSISGLLYRTTTSECGMFVNLSGCVKNLTIDDSYFICQYTDIKKNIGGICNVLETNGRLLNCHFNGTIDIDQGTSEKHNVGGIVGYNKGLITDCSVSGNIKSCVYADKFGVGGIAGRNLGTISFCHNTATISNSYVTTSYSDSTKYSITGGIVGYSENGNVTDCYNDGTISGYGFIGGIVGMSKGVTLERCYNTGTVKEYGSSNAYVHAGGILGNASGGTNLPNVIKNCYNTGNVQIRDTYNVSYPNFRACGILGSFNTNYSATLEIKYCFNYGTISGHSSYTILPIADRNITNCYYLASSREHSDGIANTTPYLSSDFNKSSVTGYKVINYLNVDGNEGIWKSGTNYPELISSAPKVASIAVTKEPANKVYITGEYFDPTGMLITATYSDGSTVPVINYTIVGINEPLPSKRGAHNIQITYENVRTDLTIQLNPLAEGAEFNATIRGDYKYGLKAGDITVTIADNQHIKAVGTGYGSTYGIYNNNELVAEDTVLSTNKSYSIRYNFKPDDKYTMNAYPDYRNFILNCAKTGNIVCTFNFPHYREEDGTFSALFRLPAIPGTEIDVDTVNFNLNGYTKDSKVTGITMSSDNANIILNAGGYSESSYIIKNESTPILSSSAKFAEFTDYFLHVKFTINDGYNLPEDFWNEGELIKEKFKLNGIEDAIVTEATMSGSGYNVIFKLPQLGTPSPVGKINLTLNNYIAGRKFSELTLSRSNNVKVGSNEYYMEFGLYSGDLYSAWYLGEAVLAVNDQYNFSYRMNIAPGYDASELVKEDITLSTPYGDCTATLCEWSDAFKQYWVTFELPRITNIPISTVEVSDILKPAVGVMPDNSVSVNGTGVTYDTEGTYWGRWDSVNFNPYYSDGATEVDSVVFRDDETYIFQINLMADTGYEFNASTKFYFEGTELSDDFDDLSMSFAVVNPSDSKNAIIHINMNDITHVHAAAAEWNYNETHHWHNCTVPGCDASSNSELPDYASHTFVDGKCTCGLHLHNWSSEWSYNETHHWHDCVAGSCTVMENNEKSGYAAHRFVSGKCACGVEKVITSIEISGITAPVTGATPVNSAILDKIGVKVDEDATFWVRFDSTTGKTTDTYKDGSSVHNTPFRSGEIYMLQVAIEPKTGFSITAKTKIIYNGNELSGLNEINPTKSYAMIAPDNSMAIAGICLKPLKEYKLSVTNGKATVENGSTRTKAIPGTSLTMTANEAPSGKIFDKWVITGYTNEYVYSSSYTFIMPSGDVNAVATYKDITGYTVSFHANGGTGTINDVKGITGKYTLPSNSFTAPTGKHFKCWSINGVEKNPGDKVTLTANVTIKAVWDSCNAKKIAKINPTCLNKGKKAYYYCEVCKTYYEDSKCSKVIENIDKWGKIKATGHTFVWVTEKPAKSDKDGSKHEECSTCNYKKESVIVPATGAPVLPDVITPIVVPNTAPIITPTPDFVPTLSLGSDNIWYSYINGVLDLNYTGLSQLGDNWWMVVNGTIDFNYTSLVFFDNDWWFVRNGLVEFTYNGLAFINDNWWYVVNGRIDFGYNGLAFVNDNWWYVSSGRIDFNYTGLIYFSDSWWFVQNGCVNFSYYGLAFINDNWWYVVNGRIDFTYCGLFDYNDESWYVQCGKIDFTYKNVYFFNDTWWYIEDGKINFNYNGLAFANEKWWYVEKGIITFTYNGPASVLGKNWYVQRSEIDFTFSGKVTINGVKYTVKNGEIIS